MRALQKKRRLQVTFVLLTNMISSRPLCQALKKIIRSLG